MGIVLLATLFVGAMGFTVYAKRRTPRSAEAQRSAFLRRLTDRTRAAWATRVTAAVAGGVLALVLPG